MFCLSNPNTQEVKKFAQDKKTDSGRIERLENEIERLENEIERYKQEVITTQNSQTEEITHWRQTAHQKQMESGSHQDEILNNQKLHKDEMLNIQRRHEKVTHSA